MSYYWICGFSEAGYELNNIFSKKGEKYATYYKSAALPTEKKQAALWRVCLCADYAVHIFDRGNGLFVFSHFGRKVCDSEWNCGCLCFINFCTGFYLSSNLYIRHQKQQLSRQQNEDQEYLCVDP